MKPFKSAFFLKGCLFASIFSSFFLGFYVFAGNWKNLQSGDQTAQMLLNQLESKKKEAGSHPFYQGMPKEANYTNDTLKAHAQTLIHNDPVGQMISESHNSRPKVKIDIEHDPLLKRSKTLLENPFKEIGGEGTHLTQVDQGGKDEIQTCEEAGEDAQYTCKSNLIVTMKEELGPIQSGSLTLSGPSFYSTNRGMLSFPRVRKKHFVGYLSAGEAALKQVVSNHKGIPVSQIGSVSGGQSGGWVHVDHKTYTFSSYYINYQYQTKVKTPSFSWEGDCCALEERVDQGHCYYVSKTCTQGPQTRIIEGVPVTRDCWQETFTYNCTHPSKGLSSGEDPGNDCGPLRARGCVQINSACKEKVGNVCVVYTQTYQCKGNIQKSDVITGGQAPFCLDGNCRDQGWDANDEMMSSIAQLALLKELQGQWTSGSFFKGSDERCSKQPVSFKDCCGSGKGWGNDLGLSSCKAEEKLLSKKRKSGLCHYVGTYCSKKVLGQCIKKKSTYCCFNNKLLKAFHEQGRPQIGLGWGSPEEPLCRGFSIDEIQRIDFSKLDLREAFEDLIKNFNPGKAQGLGKSIGERIEDIKKGLVPNLKTQPPQRPEA